MSFFSQALLILFADDFLAEIFMHLGWIFSSSIRVSTANIGHYGFPSGFLSVTIDLSDPSLVCSGFYFH